MEAVMKQRNARIHSPAEQDLILVVHRHHDEQLRVTTVQIGPQKVLGAHELVRVARRGSVPHLVHLFGGVSFGDDMRRDLHVEDEIPILQLDVAHRSPLHQLLPRRRVPTSALRIPRRVRRMRGEKGVGRGGIVRLSGVVWNDGHRGNIVMDIDLAHLVRILAVRIEMCLRAIVARLVGLAIPAGLVLDRCRGFVGLLVLGVSRPSTVPAGGGEYLTDASTSLVSLRV